jgi:hypothetical protein
LRRVAAAQRASPAAHALRLTPCIRNLAPRALSHSPRSHHRPAAARSKYQEKPPLPFTPGGEVSGTVLAVGAAVKGLAIGDAVLAVLPRFGGFAQQVRAAATDVFKLPPVRGASNCDANLPPAYRITLSSRLLASRAWT